MLETIFSDAESRMGKAIEVLKSELAKVRTGRAHPSILEHVTIDYYGSSVPINQVANVSVSDARTLLVVPWEKTMVQQVEKAIMNANLGLNPATAGTNIRVPMPMLTEERRKSMVRLVRQEAEAGRVAVRNIRRDVIQQAKQLQKEKEITEDDVRRAEERAQKSTDKHIADIETIVKQKEADLMEI